MKFKTKQSSTFIMNMILVLFALLMAGYILATVRFVNELFDYIALIWLLIACLRFSAYYKYIVLMVKDKPVLIVNENAIYDAAKETEFFWRDIDEIYEENAYLYIKVYNQKDYLDNIKNPLKRFFAGIGGTPLRINIDMVNVHPDVLLNILYSYCVKASV